MKIFGVETKIKNLKVEGKQVFWTIVRDTGFGKIEVSCFTNKAGEGIFHYVNDGESVKQDAGTCDFELKQKTVSGIRKALYRYYN